MHKTNKKALHVFIFVTLLRRFKERLYYKLRGILFLFLKVFQRDFSEPQLESYVIQIFRMTEYSNRIQILKYSVVE